MSSDLQSSSSFIIIRDVLLINFGKTVDTNFQQIADVEKKSWAAFSIKGQLNLRLRTKLGTLDFTVKIGARKKNTGR